MASINGNRVNDLFALVERDKKKSLMSFIDCASAMRFGAELIQDQNHKNDSSSATMEKDSRGKTGSTFDYTHFEQDEEDEL